MIKFWHKKKDIQENNSVKAAKKPWSLFSSRKQSMVILSMDDQWLKLVHVEKKSRKRKVMVFWAESIKDREDDQIIESLKALILRHGLATAHFLVLHPSHSTRARALKLPSTNQEELKVMVDLQVEKHTPDAKEETLTYFRTMDSDAEGYSNVFLVMAHQDAVSRSARIIQKLGVRFTQVASDIEGLINWHAHYLVEFKREKIGGGTLLIDIDNDHATLLIFHGSEAYFHRTIPVSMEALLHDPTGDALAQFLGEVHRSLMGYEEEGFKEACVRLLLTGEAVKLSVFATKIETEMKLPTVIVAADAGFELDPSAAKHFTQAPPVSFAGLLGFLTGPVTGDLTPSAIKIRQAFEKKVKMVGILSVQILTGLLLVCGFLLHRIQQDMKYESFLKSQIMQMAQPANALEVSLEHLRIVKGRLEKAGALLEAMIVIKKATPAEIHWDSLIYMQGESIAIKGISSQMAKVFEMVTNLEKSTMFIKPEARRVTKRKVDERDVTDFEVIMPFSGLE